MRVLHVVPSYYPAVRYGGPIVSVRRLCQALAQAGVEVDVATTDADGSLDLAVPTNCWTELDGVRVRYFHRWPSIDFAASMSLARFLKAEVRGYDLVHVVGTFSFPSLAAACVARTAGVPYVVSPRGSVEPWSLAQKRWKKRPYWVLFEKRNLAAAAAIHATAESEAAAVRGIFPQAQVFVSPNGVEQMTQHNVARSPMRVVFLGRIHKKKGIDILVRAMSRVTEEFRDVETVVAGPDDEGEWARIETLIGTLSPRPRVRYLGTLVGDERWRLLASGTAFALPSWSENFGVAVIEALACGTPAVVSKNCPWSIVEERGAGYWVDNQPEAFAEALSEILRDPARAAVMGEVGAQLAKEYSWPRLGEEMADHYRAIVDAKKGVSR